MTPYGFSSSDLHMLMLWFSNENIYLFICLFNKFVVVVFFILGGFSITKTRPMTTSVFILMYENTRNEGDAAEFLTPSPSDLLTFCTSACVLSQCDA